MSVEFFIKRPSPKNGRRTYALIRRITDDLGQIKNETFKHPVVDAVNQALLTREHPLSYLDAQLKGLIVQLKSQASPKAAILNNPANLRVLDSFWKTAYPASRLKRLSDEKTLYADYRRAVEALGNLSLMNATNATIQQTLDEGFKGKKHRRIVSRLKSIFTFLGRTEIRLQPDEEETVDVAYITESEMTRVCSYLKDPFLQLLVRAAFYTGGRLGELFALESGSFNEKSVWIAWQIRPDLEKKLPKRKKRRRAYVPPEGRKFIRDWCDLDSEEKLSRRDRKYAQIIRAACRKAFPSSKAKHIDFKGLRHSYAVYLLGKNINLSLVAKSLGNGEEVCRKHYAGHVAVEADIEAMDAILRR